MYYGWQAAPFIQLFALEKLVPREAEYGEVGREYRHGRVLPVRRWDEPRKGGVRSIKSGRK